MIIIKLNEMYGMFHTEFLYSKSCLIKRKIKKQMQYIYMQLNPKPLFWTKLKIDFVIKWTVR